MLTDTSKAGACRSGILLSLCLACFLSLPGLSYADEIYRVRLFFGLSIPGGGAVSLHEWNNFQQQEIASRFEGFNVVESMGFYKGKPERSRIVTLIVRNQEIPKARELASLYARRFHQDSVMFVKVPVLEWDFITAKE